MKKLLALAIALLVGAGVYSSRYPADADRYAATVADKAQLVWSKIEANPIPVVIALGTFLFTFVYHKAKGKSFRESVEVAATRVTVVTPPLIASQELLENPVLKRAKARATRTQLMADQIEIRNRISKLPDAVVKAEKDFCFAEKAVNELKANLGEKHKVRNQAATKLNSLRAELSTGTAELDAIDAELEKLAEML